MAKPLSYYHSGTTCECGGFFESSCQHRQRQYVLGGQLFPRCPVTGANTYWRRIGPMMPRELLL